MAAPTRELQAESQLIVALGMSIWKRARVEVFLRQAGASKVLFRTGADRAVKSAHRKGADLVVWATREPPQLAPLAEAAGVRVLRMEDGFIRSLGLGSDFLQGASAVLDRRGIYYDPRQPSDLEHILATYDFDEALLDRGRRLIAQIVATGVSKYNVGSADYRLPPMNGQWRILVPGQVEDDRSLVLGQGLPNLDLLAKVRAARPDAWITFKPHPDVDAGHRRGAIADGEARRFADQVVRGVSAPALIKAHDEVHTSTSLCGFEALLHGCKVTTYGQPFYAGWGLTMDLNSTSRRGRHLSVEALAAGALILYPRYLDPRSSAPCGPEQVVAAFAGASLPQVGLLTTLRRLQGLSRLKRRRFATGAR
ncbi:hypothetical protein [Caulobacter sp. S45]|uniref:capsular polysaccharide export protein, LipB/KpsS family n=1 Tax=Caulobacter sp. S45 TaxID=1641861 RepID=UPI0015760993|nr:hypothetical protein [Caulobacter sp. S45]